MSEYNFIKSGIEKIEAFEAYLITNFAFYQNFDYSDPDLIVRSTIVLDSTQLDELTTLVANYVDPAVFLQLDTTTTDCCRSLHTSSSTLENVLTFIFTSKNFSGDSTFNAIKTVFECYTNDITQFANGSTSASITFEIFDYSRQVVISSNVIDITDILDDWQTRAQTETGSTFKLKSFMVEGLRNMIVDYDCIWQFRLSVSNPNVSVCTNSMQRLYYNLL